MNHRLCLDGSINLMKLNYRTLIWGRTSSRMPGSEVSSGNGAQEENIFRRTSAYKSLYQFVYLGCQHGVSRNVDFAYPIPDTSGGIYSPELIVFRSSEATGYHLLDSNRRCT